MPKSRLNKRERNHIVLNEMREAASRSSRRDGMACPVLSSQDEYCRMNCLIFPRSAALHRPVKKRRIA